MPTDGLPTDVMPTLETIPAGRTVRIREIRGEDAIAVRLMEMGLTEGEAIEVLGFAPLGDPMECLVRGYRISLRITEARRIAVESNEPQ